MHQMDSSAHGQEHDGTTLITTDQEQRPQVQLQLSPLMPPPGPVDAHHPQAKAASGAFSGPVEEFRLIPRVMESVQEEESNVSESSHRHLHHYNENVARSTSTSGSNSGSDTSLEFSPITPGRAQFEQTEISSTGSDALLDVSGSTMDDQEMLATPSAQVFSAPQQPPSTLPLSPLRSASANAAVPAAQSHVITPQLGDFTASTLMSQIGSSTIQTNANIRPPPRPTTTIAKVLEPRTSTTDPSTRQPNHNATKEEAVKRPSIFDVKHIATEEYSPTNESTKMSHLAHCDGDVSVRPSLRNSSTFQNHSPRNSGRNSAIHSLYGKDLRKFVSISSLRVGARQNIALDWSDSDHNLHDTELSLMDPQYDLTTSKLTKLFALFQSDENGMVNYEGFRKGLEAMGIVCHDDEAFAIFLDKVDEDKSGGISFQEFQHAVQEIKLAQLFNPEFMKGVFEEDARRIAMNAVQEDASIRPPPTIGVIEYSPDRIRSVCPIEHFERFIYSRTPSWASVRWINVEHCDLLTLRRLSVRYRLHPLAVEKALDLENERPKFETYDEHSCLVLQSVYAMDITKLRKYQRLYHSFIYSREDDESSSWLDQLTDKKEIEARLAEIKCIMSNPVQISMYLLADVLICVQQGKCAFYHGVKARLDTSYSKIRQHGANFLVHTIIDACVGDLNPIVDAYGAKLLLFEKLLRVDANHFEGKRLQYCSRQLMALQQVCKRFVELVNHLCESNSAYFEQDLRQYLSNVRDQLLNVLQDCDKHLATCRALQEELQGFRAARQAEVSYTLTVVAAIFLPANFLTGLYGMNFENMPELRHHDGYFIWWGVLLIVAVGIISFFRFYKKWI